MPSPQNAPDWVRFVEEANTFWKAKMIERMHNTFVSPPKRARMGAFWWTAWLGGRLYLSSPTHDAARRLWE